jgi:hypothetical protein
MLVNLINASSWQTTCSWNPSVSKWVFLITLILWNNSELTNLQRLYHAVFHVLRRPRPQDAGTPSLLAVFHFSIIHYYSSQKVTRKKCLEKDRKKYSKNII